LSDNAKSDIRLMFYNVENLFDTFNDSLINDEEFLPFGAKHWNKDKFRKKINRIYKVIMNVGEWEPPALIGLCEIENRFVLDELISKTPLAKYNYHIIHQESPDLRGIDVALLYRKEKFTPDLFKAIHINLNNSRKRTRDILYVRGEIESREESFGGMKIAVIIALISIFAVLVLQFKSFKQPLIVYSAIPLAVIGSIWALFIAGKSFSFTAFIGITSLVGIVINNSIILVDYTNKLHERGKSIIEAIKIAGETRFTPIILTTLTTIGGLLPITLRGGQLWAPMGWSIIGGLIVSTTLTLILVPVLYKLFSGKKE